MRKVGLLYIFTFFQCFCLEYRELDSTFCKGLSYISFVLVWLYSIMQGRGIEYFSEYDKKISMTFKVITASLFLSIIPAVIIEEQSFSISLMTTIGFIFSMMTYNVIRRLQVSAQSVERMIISFGFVYVAIVIINILTFPDMLFGSGELDLDRGGIRMRSNMLMFGVFSFFYFVNNYIVNKKKKNLLFALIMFFAVSSTLFRVYIVLMLGLASIMLLKYESIQRKVRIGILLFIIFFLVIPQTTIYKNLVEVSEAQKELSNNSKEDVRLQAYRYFVLESQTGLVSVLMGHGIASLGNSDYGEREEIRQDNTGVYQADVGWAGCFYDFGIVVVLAFAFLLFSGILVKKSSPYRYLSYFYVFYVLGAIANGHFQYSMQMLILPLSFYVLTHNNDCLQNDTDLESNEQEVSLLEQNN